MAMIEDVDVRNHRPLFVIGDSGVMRYEEQSRSATAARQDSVPAVAVNLVGPIDVASVQLKPDRRGLGLGGPPGQASFVEALVDIAGAIPAQHLGLIGLLRALE